MILKASAVLCVLATFFMLAAYFGPSNVFENKWEEISEKPAVVFIHGFYGAALKERGSGRRYFYSVREALFGHSALSLFQNELATPPGPDLEVEGIVGRVPVLPYVYEEDAYSAFLGRLKEGIPAGSQLVTIAYDWRDDLSLAVAKLDQVVKRLQAKGSPSIQVIAHSMGGMVLSYYLGYGAQPVESAVLNWEGAKNLKKALFFGTPFRGSLIAFRSFIKGSGLTLSQRTMPADAMASFPALFQLNPHAPGKFLKSDGSKIELDLWDLKVWEENGMGLLYRKDLPESVQQARRAFTEKWLRLAKLWSDKIQLAGSPPPPHLRVLNVLGRGQETLDVGYFVPESDRKVIFDPSETSALGLEPKAVFADGDLSTTWESGQVPATLAPLTKTLTTLYTHGKLFLDPAIETEYKAFLQP